MTNSTSAGSYCASPACAPATTALPQSDGGASRLTPPYSTGTSKRFKFRKMYFMDETSVMTWEAEREAPPAS